MTIESFNGNNVKTIRNEIENAISEVCKRHGIKPPSLGNISYVDEYFTTGKLTFAIESKMNKLTLAGPLTKENLQVYVGKRYKWGQRTFSIMKVNEDCSLSATTNRGARYKIRVDQLKNMIEL